MITCEIFSHVCVAGHQLPAVADILTHSVNMAFGPKSAFKNKCRAQTRFGLQNEACLHPIRLDAFLRLYLGIFLRGLMTFVLNKVKSLNKAKPMYPHIAVKWRIVRKRSGTADDCPAQFAHSVSRFLQYKTLRLPAAFRCYCWLHCWLNGLMLVTSVLPFVMVLLQHLVQVYKEPLEQKVSEGQPLLAQEDICSVFGGIPDIARLHASIHKDLSDLIDDWDEGCCIADVINKYQEQLIKV